MTCFDIKQPNGFMNVALFTAEHMKTKLAKGKKIDIYDDYSFEHPVTVQWFENTILMHCDHAGAEIEEVDTGYADSRLGDYVDNWTKLPVCDKCNEVVWTD